MTGAEKQDFPAQEKIGAGYPYTVSTALFSFS